MALSSSVYNAEPIPEAARAEVEALLASGDLFRYTAQADAPVSLLERDFAAFMGSRFALAVNSCSSAIFLSLRALGVAPGQEVLIPAFTFAAVPSAIVHAGARPVLVEVGENYRIDLEDFRAKLHAGTGAVVISHMRGHTSDMDAIMEMADALGVPVVEDAAHSLGTLWQGRKIGTIGRVGCLSFQSYKLVNGGEGGILITDDEDVFAQAVIMSGAYEHNWKKHPALTARFAAHQNALPLYNMRMNNLSAAVIRPQIAEIDRRVRQGRENHDHVAEALNSSPWIDVPPAMPKEQRAPDSLQFNLVGFTDAEARDFMDATAAAGVGVQIFGMAADNARAFWNWRFLGDTPDLPRTRAMLMRACDTRLPARLTRAELDAIAGAILAAAEAIKGEQRAFGT
ncbi:MAG: aminotransferase class I/II-fold pyridoxal phosphate-dependent enzyme [Rhodobacteraceae bacterium]|nr:aminotransferase class I/II-fold pyridoxal phosphate-dependent enzyme [Paracoccaceae bacterium]